MSELDHSKADLPCASGLHAFVGGRCRDCGDFEKPAAPKPRRIVKRFLVQFEGDERTRWLATDEQTRRSIESLMKTTAHSMSGGTIPATIVTIEP